MYTVTLGTDFGSAMKAEVFQMSEDLDRCILTVETQCNLGPEPGHVFEISRIQIHGTRAELHRLAELIYDAAEKLKDDPPPVVDYLPGDNHTALFDATDIEHSLKYGER